MIEYGAYIKSDQWKAKRREALADAGNRCQVCNGESRLEVHHRTYERLGFERREDLVVLCRGCHRTFHENRTLDPYKAFSKRQDATCCFCGKTTESWSLTEDGRAHCAPPCVVAQKPDETSEAA